MESLLPLTLFISPSGSEISARIHITRSVRRYAKSNVVTLFDEYGEIETEILQYINRLSGWLFVLARYVTHCLKGNEILWNPKLI